MKTGTITATGEIVSAPGFTLASSVSDATYRCNSKKLKIVHTRYQILLYNPGTNLDYLVKMEFYKLFYNPSLGYIDTTNVFNNFQRYAVGPGTPGTGMFISNPKSEWQTDRKMEYVKSDYQYIGPQLSAGATTLYANHPTMAVKIFDFPNQFEIEIEDSKFVAGGNVFLNTDVIGDFIFLILSQITKGGLGNRSEEHTSELQSLREIS